MTGPRRLAASPAGPDRPRLRRKSRPCTSNVTFEVPPHDVYVWCAFCDEIRDESLVAAYERSARTNGSGDRDSCSHVTVTGSW